MQAIVFSEYYSDLNVSPTLLKWTLMRLHDFMIFLELKSNFKSGPNKLKFGLRVAKYAS